MVPVLTAMTVALVAALLVAEKWQWQVGRWAFKIAASLGFVGAAVAAGAANARYGQLVLLGLVLSLAGDVLLIPASKRAFLGGLASFLLAHVSYSAAFVALGVRAPAALGALVPVGVFGAGVAAWLLPHVKGPMRGPVIAYLVAIVAMVCLAAGTFGSERGGLRLLAAVTFLASDLFVARERFVAPGFENRAAGLPLYYAAQLVFAASTS